MSALSPEDPIVVLLSDEAVQRLPESLILALEQIDARLSRLEKRFALVEDELDHRRAMEPPDAAS